MGTAQPFRVILVEDEALIMMDLEQGLAEEGVEVAGVAGTLDDAMVLARTADYDAAVFDIDLQGEEVFPAAEIARERGNPFIFFSGHADARRLRGTYPDVPLVQKPATAHQIYAALRNVA